MDAAVRPEATRITFAQQPPNAHPFAVERQAVGTSSSGEVVVAQLEQTQRTSSSTATLPRLTSVHVSNSESHDGTRPWDATSEPQPAAPGLAAAGPGAPSAGAAADINMTRVSSSSSGLSGSGGGMLGSDELGDQDAAVLTPSRLRLDSRVVFAHATLQWLTNAIWAVLIWLKLDGRLRCSWWGVFAPTLCGHALHVPMHLAVMAAAEHLIYLQIGPPPPASASPGLLLHYGILRHVRLRTHRVDAANNAAESGALLLSKILFCNALARGRLASTSLRLIFTPVWVVWGASVLLLCFKDRSERVFGSSRDLLFIFLLFVAFKVDGASSYSWRVVFLVPWMWFSGLLLVAALVLLLLLFARCWSRPRELLLPLGFALLLLASLPQFVSYIALVRRLDGDAGTSIKSILLPNALSWLLMWASGLLLAAALRAKEGLRAELLARGAVWTAHAAVARRLTAEREEATRRVEALSEEEVSRLVESMMAGKSKPGRLRRVGATLYRRIASLEPALAEQAAEQATGAASIRLKPPSRPPSASSPTASGAAVAPLAASGVRPPLPRPGPRPASAPRSRAAQLGPGLGTGPIGSTGPLAAGAPSLPPLRPASATLGGGGGLPRSALSFRLAPGGPGPAAGGPGSSVPAYLAVPLPLKRSRVLPLGAPEGAAGAGAGSGASRGADAVAAEGAGAEFEAESGAAAAGAAAKAVQRQWLSDSGGAVDAAAAAAAAGAAAAAAAVAGAAGGSCEIAPVCGAEAEEAAASGAEPRVDRAGGSFRIGTRPLPDPETPGRGQGDQPDAAAAAPAHAPPAGPTAPAGHQEAGSGRKGVWRPTSAPPGTGPRGDSGSGGRGGLWWSPRGLSRGLTGGVAAGGAPLQAVPEGPGAAAPAASQPGSGAAAACPEQGTDAAGGAPVGASRRSPAALPAGEPGEDTGAGAGAQTEPVLVPADGSGVATSDGAAAAASSGEGGGAEAPAATSADAAGGGDAAADAGAGGACGGDEGDNACVICYDGEARCVFLECGHGGFCRRCAHLLFVRPPNECPTCRQPIEQVVEVEDVAPVGQVARVK